VSLASDHSSAHGGENRALWLVDMRTVRETTGAEVRPKLTEAPVEPCPYLIREAERADARGVGNVSAAGTAEAAEATAS
jgi:hypothetical protein